MTEKHIAPGGQVYYTVSGDISVWAEPGGPLVIKTTDAHGDPVELNADEAKDLIALLQMLVRGID
jgi:hypothetical protein